MYRLWHLLFGWDYIHWDNTIDAGVSRVYVTPGGNVCYWRYKITHILDVITDPTEVIWLTCKSDKYFP